MSIRAVSVEIQASEQGSFWSDRAILPSSTQNKPFSYTYISTTATPIDTIQNSVYLSQLVLYSPYLFRLSNEVFLKLSKHHFIQFLLHGVQHDIQISYPCQRCIQNICILPYLYGNYSLELWEDIELFVLCNTFAQSLQGKVAAHYHMLLKISS